MGYKGKDVQWGDEREEIRLKRQKNILILRATRKALNQP
jgi:hypothetical protein